MKLVIVSNELLWWPVQGGWQLDGFAAFSYLSASLMRSAVLCLYLVLTLIKLSCLTMQYLEQLVYFLLCELVCNAIKQTLLTWVIFC